MDPSDVRRAVLADHAKLRKLMPGVYRAIAALGVEGTHGHDAFAAHVSELLAEHYLKAAEAVSERAVQDMPGLLDGCDPAVDGEVTCADAFIESFGRRAYRRPLATEEIEALQALYDEAMADPDLAIFETAIRMIIEVVLQSPHFLYRPELRPVRMQLELLKPEMYLATEGVDSTIVVFGGTQIVERDEAQKRLDDAREALAKKPDDRERRRLVARAEDQRQAADPGHLVHQRRRARREEQRVHEPSQRPGHG